MAAVGSSATELVDEELPQPAITATVPPIASAPPHTRSFRDIPMAATYLDERALERDKSHIACRSCREPRGVQAPARHSPTYPVGVSV
jgi:hypothetical protein